LNATKAALALWLAGSSVAAQCRALAGIASGDTEILGQWR